MDSLIEMMRDEPNPSSWPCHFSQYSWKKHLRYTGLPRQSTTGQRAVRRSGPYWLCVCVGSQMIELLRSRAWWLVLIAQQHPNRGSVDPCPAQFPRINLTISRCSPLLIFVSHSSHCSSSKQVLLCFLFASFALLLLYTGQLHSFTSAHQSIIDPSFPTTLHN